MSMKVCNIAKILCINDYSRTFDDYDNEIFERNRDSPKVKRELFGWSYEYKNVIYQVQPLGTF